MLLAFLTALVAPTYACAPAEVESAVQEGLIAFATMDEDGVADAVALVDGKVSCQTAPLPVETAAQVHRMHGLAAFLEGDAVGAKSAFAAALALDPQTLLPAKIAPEGGKLARLYGESTLPVGATADMGLSADYRGYVNGSEASKRPTDRPAVVQMSMYDTVKYSAWLKPTSPIPTQFQVATAPTATAEPKPEPVAKPEPKPKAEPKPEPEPKPERVARPEKEAAPATHHKNTGVWVATGLSAALAGGLFATSVVTHGSFEDDPTRLGYTLNHVGYWGSIGAGALTVGLLTVGIAGSF
jgi:outer membrane biosynthesis protein TonB